MDDLEKRFGLKRVAEGKLKVPEKFGAAARILSCNHSQRYYGYRIKEGKIHYREKAYEGKYLIQTEKLGLTPVEAYKTAPTLSFPHSTHGLRDSSPNSR